MGTLVFRLMRILLIVAVASGALLSVLSVVEQQMRSRPATETVR
jgi:hypothetical protein